MFATAFSRFRMSLLAAAALSVLLVGGASANGNVAPAAAHCEAGSTPQFRFGLAFLHSVIGETMGDPIECAHVNPDNGDVLQQTSTGLAYYRAKTGAPEEAEHLSGPKLEVDAVERAHPPKGLRGTADRDGRTHARFLRRRRLPSSQTAPINTRPITT